MFPSLIFSIFRFTFLVGVEPVVTGRLSTAVMIPPKPLVLRLLGGGEQLDLDATNVVFSFRLHSNAATSTSHNVTLVYKVSK